MWVRRWKVIYLLSRELGLRSKKGILVTFKKKRE